MNPDVGPRCGECRLGLGAHNTADPLCDHHDPNRVALQESLDRD